MDISLAPRAARTVQAPDLADIAHMVDVVMVQCWLFGLEMCAGASLTALCELLDAEWPESYRPRATA